MKALVLEFLFNKVAVLRLAAFLKRDCSTVVFM